MKSVMDFLTYCQELISSTLSYHKARPMYCIYKMRCDYLWLSSDMLQYCKEKYMAKIDAMNANYNLENGRADCSQLKDTASFTESLYLLHSHLQGELWSVPNNESIQGDYRTSNLKMLLELCKRGVYTVDGSEPNDVTRSTHNFIVLVNDIVADKFIALLKMLYHRGVNVCARKVKNNTIVQELAYAKDCGKLLYTDDLKSATLPNGFHSLGVCDDIVYSELFTECIDSDFGISGLYTCSGKSISDILKHSDVEKEKSELHSLFYVETWSQTHDGFRVEDVFFQLWLEFNSKYGHMNELR